MLEPVNNPRFGGVVRRHLHSYAIADGKANKTFAHFAGDMRKDKMFVRERDSKHRAGQHAHYRSFYADRFLGIHSILTAENAEDAEKIP
jgi:hypothetical protein